MSVDPATILLARGVQPSAQRVAVAEYVLTTDDHPSADQVWAKVRASFPMISRATVYNTLNLFVRKQLLRELILSQGRVVFDPNLEAHHHFVDDQTGVIMDIPWNAVRVDGIESLADFEVREHQVVMRGTKRAR